MDACPPDPPADDPKRVSPLGRAAAKRPFRTRCRGGCGDDTDYEPDAVVNCGERPDPEGFVAPQPVIVVEVLSPSSRSTDAGAKLADYFRVPSVQHYLMVDTRRLE